MWFDRIFFGSLTLAAASIIFAFGAACGRGLERPEAEIVIKRFIDTETVKSLSAKLDAIASAAKAPPPMPCCSEPVAVAPASEPPCDYCGDRCPCLVCTCGIAAKPIPAQTKEPPLPAGVKPVGPAMFVAGQPGIPLPPQTVPPLGYIWVLYSDGVYRLVSVAPPVVVPAPRPAVVIGVGVRVGGRGKR